MKTTSTKNMINKADLFIENKNGYESHELCWVKNTDHLIDLVDSIICLHLKYNRGTDITAVSLGIEADEQSAELCKHIEEDLSNRIRVEGSSFLLDVYVL